MKYHGFLVVVSASIVSNFLVSLIKAAVHPYQLWAIAGLLVMVGTLIFAIRDPHTVSDVFKIEPSPIKICAFLALLVSVATASIVYVS